MGHGPIVAGRNQLRYGDQLNFVSEIDFSFGCPLLWLISVLGVPFFAFRFQLITNILFPPQLQSVPVVGSNLPPLVIVKVTVCIPLQHEPQDGLPPIVST